MKKKLIFMFWSFAIFMVAQAQEQTDSYLQDIARVVKELRKSNNSTRNSAIATLSADQKPKITLMDEIKWAGDKEEKANEVKGAKGNHFKLNQVVAYVYKKQNHLLESKNGMLNGNEKDIHYSIIEKSVKRGRKVTYQLYGRKGEQDFMFIPFNPNSRFVVTMYVNGLKVDRKESTDTCQIHLERLSGRQTIVFSINYLDDKANKDLVESFAIINYNPQK
jgi:hypothetical protein